MRLWRIKRHKTDTLGSDDCSYSREGKLLREEKRRINLLTTTKIKKKLKPGEIIGSDPKQTHSPQNWKTPQYGVRVRNPMWEISLEEEEPHRSRLANRAQGRREKKRWGASDATEIKVVADENLMDSRQQRKKQRVRRKG